LGDKRVQERLSKHHHAVPEEVQPLEQRRAYRVATNKPHKEVSNGYPFHKLTKDVTEKAKLKEEVSKKYLEIGREATGKEVEKTCPPFNFEHEMAKIKIYVSFNELIIKGEYQEQIIKMLKMGGPPIL
jgi:tRNA U54 and U55 pseudouridine synthase Pus10